MPAELHAALDGDKLRARSPTRRQRARRDGRRGELTITVETADSILNGSRSRSPTADRAFSRDRGWLFDPFVTRGKKNGTGLGLAVARRFVEDHGGSIELLKEGPGARFRMSLPLGG